LGDAWVPAYHKILLTALSNYVYAYALIMETASFFEKLAKTRRLHGFA
jgi:hypothetical protein